MSPLNDSGMLIWTTRLTLLVSGAGGLLAVGAVIAGVLGHGSAAGIMGIAAAVALLVAISGRWTTIRSERWAGADTPPTTARVRRNRVVIRRRDTASLILFCLCAAGTAVTVPPNAGTPVGVAAILGAMGSMTIAFGLAAFASRTIVTADELTVDRMFTRWVIPRNAVGKLRRTDSGAVGITAAGAEREIRMPTGMNTMFIRGSWDYRPAETRALGLLRSALKAVPAGPGGGDQVVVRRRIVPIALAVLAAAGVATDIFLLATHRLA